MEFNLSNEGVRITNPPAVWNTANKSDQHLVEVATGKCFYRRSPSLRKLKVSLLLAAILIVILFVLSLFLGLHYYKTSNELEELNRICRSPECIRSASSLLLSMNKSVDPCNDFYEFACGRWSEEHPIPYTSLSTDWFGERTTIVLAKIKEFLERNSSETDAYPTVQSRIMYEACIDTDKIQKLGLEPLTAVLAEMGLPLIPALNETEYQSNIDISSLLALVKTTIGKDMILFSNIYPDVANKTRNLITVGAPDLHTILPSYNVYKRKRHFPVESIIRKELVSGKGGATSPWKRYFTVIIKYFLKSNNITNATDKAITETVSNLLKIYVDIQTVMSNSNITVANDPHPNIITLSELQDITDEAAESAYLTSKISWFDYMNTMFEHSNVTVDFENEELAVYTLEYYKAISIVLSNHSDYEIALYIWSEVVTSLIPFTNEELRSVRHSFLASFGEPAPLPRETHCTTSVWEVMDKGVAVGLIKGVDVTSMRKDVNKMIDNIEYSLTKFINRADWIDAETRAAIIEKALRIDRYIGYPEWLLNVEDLEDYYAGLNVTEDTHMLNFVNAAQVFVRTTLDQLYIENDFSYSDFDPIEVNAQYVPSANAITIPLGILQFPFYNLGLDALNYGAIGVIIGHELTHAFDTTGREYDKVGNVKEWWTNTTTENYLERVECFIDHYNAYFIEDIDESVDGNLTLAENIADNGGLKDAYYGYQRLKEEKGFRGMRLPGLEEYSEDKLFYLGFAHAWCENWTPRSMKLGLEDEHSPNFVRVLGSLSNSKEFSSTWGCPADSDMNFAQKCQLW